MNNNICFQSKWFEKCMRNYLEIGVDTPITESMLAAIKYLYVSTTNDYELAFGKQKLPVQFEFIGDKNDWCLFKWNRKYKTLYRKII